MTIDPTAATGPTAGPPGASRRSARSSTTAPTTPVPADAPATRSTTPEPPKPATPEPPATKADAPPAAKPAEPSLDRSAAAQPPGTVAPTTIRPDSVEDEPPVASPGTVVPPAPGGTPVPRGPRRARLQIRQVDPWSVMKLGFLLSLALGIVFVVAIALLWSLLDSGGVFDSINKVVADVVSDQTDFTVQGSLAFRRVMGVTLVLAVIQVVLITALATLGAFLYNLAAGLVGGLDVTLVEDN